MGEHYLNFVVQTDTFAGLSAMMAYWLWVLTYGLGAFCIKHRYRYKHWWEINSVERADACLNLGFFCFMFYAATQRSVATWELGNAHWGLTSVTSIVAPFYMPFALFGLCLAIWWLCFHRYENYRRWWCNYMWTGMLIFAIVVYIF